MQRMCPTLSRYPWRTAAGRPPRRFCRPALEALEARTLLSAADERFLAQLYPDLLGRALDPIGQAAWAAALEGGAAPDQVVLAIEHSQEPQGQTIARLYRRLLHRVAEPDGFNAWLAFLAAGGTGTQLQAQLHGSAEYFQAHGGTNPAFLAALYQDVFGRALDATGSATFGPLLDQGADRVSVAAAVLGSLETQQDQVRAWYQEYLNRDPDSAGFNAFVAALQQGTPSEQVLALILGSPEYQAGPPATARNQAVTQDANVQQMPSVAVDPADSRHVVLAYLDYALRTTGYAGLGVAVSDDSGTTWQHTAVPLPAGFDQGAAAPVTHFDAQGHVFVSFAAATFLGPKPTLTDPNGGDQRALGFQADNGVFVARSDDGGQTWNAPVAVASNLYDGQHPIPFEIKPDLAIDTFPTLPNGQANPNYGDLYEVWARYYPPGQFPGESNSTGGSQGMVAVSRDGGQSWRLQLEQRPITGLLETVIEDPYNSGIGPPPGNGSVNWPHVAVGPSGEVYVSLFERGTYDVYHSTDGGKSFVSPDLSGTRGLPFGPSQATGPGDTSGLPNDHFRTLVVRAIAADPSRPGAVYAAEDIAPLDPAGIALDPGDVAFARSPDDGQTWQGTVQLGGQTARVLNDDNNGQTAQGLRDDVVTGQALPRLAVDAQGDVALIWYDTRRDPANHNLDVFATVSSDGGQAFSPNFRLTDGSFDPDAGKFTDATGQDNFYLGDAIGLALAHQTAYAAWTDTRNGNQDIFFTRCTLQPAPPPANDRFEPNDTAASATDLGRVIQTHLPKLAIPAGDEDWFRVTTASSGNLTVTATQEEPDVSPRLELRDASGVTVLATGTDLHDTTGQITGQQIIFPSAVGRTLLVRVLPGPRATPGGPSRYALDAQSLVADLGLQVHGVETNSLTPADEDYYLVRVGAAGSLQATLTPGGNFQGNVKLELVDPSTFAVLASGTGATIQQVSLPVTQGQGVLLHVASDAGGHGDFTLEFSNFDQFTTPGSNTLLFSAGQGPAQVTVADLRGDGKQDLVVTDTLTNTVSVLLGNGDGTFQAARQYAVGAFTTPVAASNEVLNLGRGVAVADLTGKGRPPDLLVSNYASGDVSVLVNNGDGTFQPQRRFDATVGPFALAVGDFNGDGLPDLVVVGSTGGPGKIAILLGRGDGTFRPPLLFPSPLSTADPAAAVQVADLDRDGKADLILTSDYDPIHILLGNGDGTFRAGATIPAAVGPALAVKDLNGDGIPDIVNAFLISDNGSYALGNGDGTFQDPQQLMTGRAPAAIAIADFGSAVTNADGTVSLGPPDGIPDLLVAASGEVATILHGPPQVLFYPGKVDAHGKFSGFGHAIVLASPHTPIDLKVADFNGDGVPDAAVVVQDGVRVLYGKPPTLPPNDTPQTARNLGTVVHVIEPALTLVPSHSDAFYTLTVPTEAAHGAGDEVLDFSGFFQATSGAGITMEVRDAAGNVLGSGERFRVVAPQGAVLTLHVYGVAAAGDVRGSGAYTLDIDVLPQVVSVEAQPLLPGVGSSPGGPTASLVVTLQGDRLDPATAEDPAHYTVTWLGPDGLPGTADDQVLPVAAGHSVVYDPSANVDVASGLTYPTAVRQTVTLLFANPLPAGSYQVALRPAIQTAAFNDQENSLLSGGSAFAGHPVVSAGAGQVSNGSQPTVPNLVLAPGSLGSLNGLTQGTPFLTQLHDDLGALLDATLTSHGDDPTLTKALLDQIVGRFDPALGPPGQRPTSMLVLWLDPAGLELYDPGGNQTTYNPSSGTLVQGIPGGFTSVVGNVEVVVVPTPGGTFTLSVGDVGALARGGVAFLEEQDTRVQSLTDDLRNGTQQFALTVN
jgi:hypothetical protein